MHQLRPRSVLAVVLSLTLCLATLAIPGQAAAQPRQHTMHVADLTTGAQIDAYLQQASFHGYMYLERQGQVLLSKGYGLADAEDKVFNTLKTKWPAFAETRFLVGLAILRLQDQGKLTVKDKMCRYISGCPVAWRPLTIEHLLLHTSGLASYDPFNVAGGRAQTLSACKAMPLLTPPGTPGPWSDCNTLLLDLILEQVTGTTWAAAMQTLVFRPAGMTGSGRMTNALKPPRRGRLYIAGSPTPELNYDGFNLAYTTAADMIKLNHTLLDGTLLSRQTRDALFKPRMHDDPNDPNSPWRGYELILNTATPRLYASVCESCTAGGGEDEEGLRAGFFMTVGFSPDAGGLQIEVVNDTGYFDVDADNAFGTMIGTRLYGKARRPVAAPPRRALPSTPDAYLADLAAHNQFSGAVLVARKETVLLSKAYGLADREHRVPNTPDTTYSVSINAPTAILGILILEEQGKLADSTPICRYLTGCPAAWQPITIGMMLEGTAAIPNYDWGQIPGRTTAQALHDLQARSLFGKPGTRINYSNGYQLVLDTIVEKVTGAPYATFLQQAIAGPAGMTHTGRLAGKGRPAHFAQVYSGSTHLTGWAYDDAFALYATTPDLYAYDTALFGSTLVSAKSRQRMFAPRIPLVPPDPGVSDGRRAYVWKTGRIAGHRTLYLVGGSTGVSTANLYFPQDDVTIILNSNDDTNDFEGIAVHLAALVFGQTITAPILPAHAVALDRAVEATFAGHDSVGNFPAAFTPGALWFPTQGPNGFAGTVTRLDTRTGRVVATIKVNTLPQGQPEKGEGDVSVVNGQVWAVDSGAQTLVRIDPATNQVVATIHLGIPATALASAGNTLWATADPASAMPSYGSICVRRRPWR